MGAGKSTVGPLLAKLLGCPFLDLDQQIQFYAKASIPQIFAQQGEQGFRDLETKVLKKIASSGACVVSLGGGALERQENRRFIQNSGLLIYLQASVVELVRRANPESRPLLKGLSFSERVQFVTHKLIRRKKNYLKSKKVVKTNGRSAQKIAHELYKWCLK